MAGAVRTHRDILHVLLRAKPCLRKAILKELPEAVIRTICEICYNIISGAVPLPPAKKAKLSKHKNILRSLARRGEKLNKKRKTLQQKGGAFLPVLLGTVLSSLFGSVLAR